MPFHATPRSRPASSSRTTRSASLRSSTQRTYTGASPSPRMLRSSLWRRCRLRWISVLAASTIGRTLRKFSPSGITVASGKLCSNCRMLRRSAPRQP